MQSKFKVSSVIISQISKQTNKQFFTWMVASQSDLSISRPSTVFRRASPSPGVSSHIGAAQPQRSPRNNSDVIVHLSCRVHASLVVRPCHIRGRRAAYFTHEGDAVWAASLRPVSEGQLDNPRGLTCVS